MRMNNRNNRPWKKYQRNLRRKPQKNYNLDARKDSRNNSSEKSPPESLKKWHQVEIRFTELDCVSSSPVVEMPGYICVQLRDRKTIYRDVNDNDITAEVNYNDGCEVRCLSRNCPTRNML